MLEESPDELERGEAQRLVLAAFGIGVSKHYVVVVHGDDAMIRDGGTEYVGGQIADGPSTVSDRLRVDVPCFLPCLARDEVQQVGVSHQLEEARFDLRREDSHREIERLGGRVPTVVGGREGAAGNDVVNMGMIVHLSAPGMKHTEETGGIA